MNIIEMLFGALLIMGFFFLMLYLQCMIYMVLGKIIASICGAFYRAFLVMKLYFRIVFRK